MVKTNAGTAIMKANHKERGQTSFFMVELILGENRSIAVK